MSEFNFKKQYLIQQLQYAATFLRLTKEQENVLFFLCNYIDTSNDILRDLTNAAKITEISALALKIKHSYEFISSSKIQYLNISDKFKKQTQEMLYDLLNFLNTVDIKKLQSILEPGLEIEENTITDSTFVSSKDNIENTTNNVIENIKENPVYKKFEKKIVENIRYYDNLLTQLYQNSVDLNELSESVHRAKDLEDEIRKFGFEVILDVHHIFTVTLDLVFKSTLPVTNDIIESMRACLIVIASIIKNKDIDLSFYLSRVENLKKLLNSFHKL